MVDRKINKGEQCRCYKMIQWDKMVEFYILII